MKKLFEDFKLSFKKQDNGLVQLILINVVVFVLMGIVYVFSKLLGNDFTYFFLQKHSHLPAPISEFLSRPWTLFTYFFSHSGIFHILFNMLALYWFGRLIHEYLGNRRLINIYILGGIVGGALYLTLFNLVPFFIAKTPILGLIGASGSVFAVAVAAATLLPDYTFHLVFIGPVRIVYIVAFYIFISFLGSVEANAGGNICHLGGALLGYVYIKQLKRGMDIGKPINILAGWIKDIGKPSMKISYRSPDGKPSQKEIDAILDKISKSGYGSLTKEEKQKLFMASEK